ncbi:prenyltransferase, partial [Candidatus Dependentiae bacterium]|nr:prenyltransferase [Candidatus Dependentiae bacterium]
MIKHYIGIARPNHWFKNIFILPGIVFALLVVPTNFNIYFLTQVVFGFISACLIMSANYT